MKFKFIYLPDDNPDDHARAWESGPAEPASPRGELRYENDGTDMVRREQLANGRSRCTAAANFQARIVRDIILDDGTEERREFGMEAELGGRRVTFVVAAAEFGRMGWVLSRLGPQAIVYPGQQQHARAAIQYLSGAIPQERIFAHLGWRQHGGQWVYLHAGGALSAAGPLGGLQVQLPAALQQFRLCPPPDAGEVVRAVRASLQVLSAAPDHISFPLLAGVYRAALGAVHCSLFLSGKSGVFKTALAALAQQHFGSTMDGSGLPANFASTANALEGLAFAAKDALLVVDDFAPTGGSGDGPLESLAERLFRAVGNAQGRHRLGGDGRLRVPQAPRALVLGTGEAVPPGQSIRARLLIVEVGAGEVQRAALSAGQRAGQEGLLAAAMGAFVVWLAGRYEAMQERLQRRVLEIRSQGQGGAGHARTPAAMAELQSGMEIFLEFAEAVGAVSRAEKEELQGRCGRALDELAGRQAKYQAARDPAVRFVALLQAALAGGQAHVADRQGKVPAEAAAWGWQRAKSGRRWVSQGTRIGWVAGNDLYLDPLASYQTAQALAGEERLPVSEQALRHQLRQCGLLASMDAGREMLQVRRTSAGRPRQVLHLRASDLRGS
jgi:hypothetical protein